MSKVRCFGDYYGDMIDRRPSITANNMLRDPERGQRSRPSRVNKKAMWFMFFYPRVYGLDSLAWSPSYCVWA